MNTGSAPDNSSRGRQAWLPAFLANAVIWGASFIFIKIAVGEMHPTWVAALRLGIGAVVLLLILLATRDRLPLDRKLWGHMIVPGIVGAAIPFTMFAYGEERVSSIVAGIWNATAALWVLPFAVLVFGVERFTVRSAIGLGVGFVGVLIVLGFWEAEASSLIGQLMCAVAALCYGVSIPYIRRFATGRSRVSGVALATMQVVIGGVASTIAALALSGLPSSPVSWSWQAIGSIIALGALGSGLAFAFNMRVITTAGASTAAFVTYLIPVVAVVLGILVLGESLTWNLPVGAVIVLAGVAVAQGLFNLRMPNTLHNHRKNSRMSMADSSASTPG